MVPHIISYTDYYYYCNVHSVCIQAVWVFWIEAPDLTHSLPPWSKMRIGRQNFRLLVALDVLGVILQLPAMHALRNLPGWTALAALKLGLRWRLRVQ